ncbi:hypothetical protein Fmac_026825 [Flemingia macrophylla]|uniref:Pentatricopeptide repeat-containing protein n=1 Tax=Flemingia macrophylla TaxID=520843 RepID=A0ABD1LG58_9FABA
MNSKSLKQGKLIHQKVVTLGLQNDIFLCKNLINLYLSCNLYDHAKCVFNTIENPCEISLWNGLMAGYTKNYMYVEALELFEKLLHHPYLKPGSYTYPSVLKACGGLCSFVLGKMIHTCLLKTGLMMNIVVGSSLVVISCNYQSGKFKEALHYFGMMRRFGFQPDSVTITTAISSCARLLDLKRGMEIHEELINSGFLPDSFSISALVDMYGKCGHLEMAIEVFEQMPKKTIVAWNSMIIGYGLKGDSISCIQFFKRMYNEGVKPTLTTLSSLIMVCSRSARLLEAKFVHGYILRNRIQPDVFINSSLMDLYFKCGKVGLAENIFNLIPKSNVVFWNVMISGYAAEGNFFDALGLFSEMTKSFVEPDAITFTSVLAACSQLAALEKGKEVHNMIAERNLDNNEVVMGALLDMYAKCGAVDEAFGVFKCLPERDLVSWTSMITAYGSHGQAYEALELFTEMLQSDVKPDRVTFLAILSACGHAGFVDEGCYYFNQMIHVYGIMPRVEHYSCLIDLLGRTGRLHEAYKILQNNPEIRDDVGLLSTLFSACCLHRNIDLGVEIARMLIDKDPDDSSTYILLSNMYASAHKWDEVRMVRSKMKELGLKKSPDRETYRNGVFCELVLIEKKKNGEDEAGSVDQKYKMEKMKLVYKMEKMKLGGWTNTYLFWLPITFAAVSLRLLRRKRRVCCREPPPSSTRATVFYFASIASRRILLRGRHEPPSTTSRASRAAVVYSVRYCSILSSTSSSFTFLPSSMFFSHFSLCSVLYLLCSWHWHVFAGKNERLGLNVENLDLDENLVPIQDGEDETAPLDDMEIIDLNGEGDGIRNGVEDLE